MKDEYEEYEDDGHVIANMNVDGMPWYRKEMPWDSKKKGEFSKEETRWIIWGTVKAALMIASVFLATFFLFVLLLCAAAWLRY